MKNNHCVAATMAEATKNFNHTCNNTIMARMSPFSVLHQAQMNSIDFATVAVLTLFLLQFYLKKEI